MGEDVYDVARQWCHVCEADHPDCDPAWLDNLNYECIVCGALIEDEEDETPHNGDWAHRACAEMKREPSDG